MNSSLNKYNSIFKKLYYETQLSQHLTNFHSQGYDPANPKPASHFSHIATFISLSFWGICQPASVHGSSSYFNAPTLIHKLNLHF